MNRIPLFTVFFVGILGFACAAPRVSPGTEVPVEPPRKTQQTPSERPAKEVPQGPPPETQQTPPEPPPRSSEPPAEGVPRQPSSETQETVPEAPSGLPEAKEKAEVAPSKPSEAVPGLPRPPTRRRSRDGKESGKLPPPALAKPPPPPPPKKKAVEHERILSAFTLDANLIVFLDPRSCARLCSKKGGGTLSRLALRFKARGVPRAEAAARVNWAATLWRAAKPEQAYKQLVLAQALFSELGDVEGLAHSFEWLGFLFQEAGAQDRAADHLGVAHKLYGFLGRDMDAGRVLGYAKLD